MRPTNPDMIHIYFAPIDQPSSKRVEKREFYFESYHQNWFWIIRLEREMKNKQQKP